MDGSRRLGFLRLYHSDCRALQRCQLHCGVPGQLGRLWRSWDRCVPDDGGHQVVGVLVSLVVSLVTIIGLSLYRDGSCRRGCLVVFGDRCLVVVIIRWRTAVLTRDLRWGLCWEAEVVLKGTQCIFATDVVRHLKKEMKIKKSRIYNIVLRSLKVSCRLLGEKTKASAPIFIEKKVLKTNKRDSNHWLRTRNTCKNLLSLFEVWGTVYFFNRSTAVRRRLCDTDVSLDNERNKRKFFRLYNLFILIFGSPALLFHNISK